MKLSEFEGTWHLTRRIEDRRAGQTGHFEGLALFTPDEDGLVYSESGKLRLPGQPAMQAERRYFWRRSAALTEVFFDDGRPFHSFDPTQSQPTAEHWCDPDNYSVRYDFSAWPDWSSDWRVTGPRKNYAMHSTFQREPSD